MKWLRRNIIIFQSGIFRSALVIVFIFLASLVVIVSVIPNNGLKPVLLSMCDYWLGIFFYLLLFLLLVDLLTVFIRLCFRKKLEGLIKSGRLYQYAGIVVLFTAILCSVFGFLHSRQIIINQSDITIEKKVQEIDELNIVLISDLHLGYQTNTNRMKGMVEEINLLQPDVVIVAGDIFNNDYDQIREPEVLIEILHDLQARYGVFAVYGNHDVSETLVGGFPLYNRKEQTRDPRMVTFLRKAGIVALSDQVTTIANESVYLVGRLDLQRPGDGSDSRKSAFSLLEGLDHEKPIIVIDHEPVEMKEVQNNGADLLLSGHTHNGQFFPFVLIQKVKWKNPHGCMKLDSMYSCVTSGIGTFAPGMRVMTTAEIMQIRVHFQK